MGVVRRDAAKVKPGLRSTTATVATAARSPVSSACIVSGTAPVPFHPAPGRRWLGV